MRYNVCFTKYYEYMVEAENKDEALEKTKSIYNPICDDDFDEIEVWESWESED